MSRLAADVQSTTQGRSEAEAIVWLGTSSERGVCLFLPHVCSFCFGHLPEVPHVTGTVTFVCPYTDASTNFQVSLIQTCGWRKLKPFGAVFEPLLIIPPISSRSSSKTVPHSLSPHGLLIPSWPSFPSPGRRRTWELSHQYSHGHLSFSGGPTFLLAVLGELFPLLSKVIRCLFPWCQLLSLDLGQLASGLCLLYFLYSATRSWVSWLPEFPWSQCPRHSTWHFISAQKAFYKWGNEWMPMSYK